MRVRVLESIGIIQSFKVDSLGEFVMVILSSMQESH